MPRSRFNNRPLSGLLAGGMPAQPQQQAQPSNHNFFSSRPGPGQQPQKEEKQPTYAPLAQPKFFPPQLADNDTGLEGLLSGSLSLADEPEIISQASKNTPRPSFVTLRGLGAVMRFLLVSAALAAFTYLEASTSLPVKQGALGVAWACAAWRLVAYRLATSSSSSPEESEVWDTKGKMLGAQALVGCVLAVFLVDSTVNLWVEGGVRVWLAVVLAGEGWASVGMMQSASKKRKRAVKSEPAPQVEKRGREISPGLGEWPRAASGSGVSQQPKKQENGDARRRVNAQPQRTASLGRNVFGQPIPPPALRKGGSGGLAGLSLG